MNTSPTKQCCTESLWEAWSILSFFLFNSVLDYWVQMDTNMFCLNFIKYFIPMWMTECWDRLSMEVVKSPSLGKQHTKKPPRHNPEQAVLSVPAWARGWTVGPDEPEVPSNLSHPVILCFLTIFVSDADLCWKYLNSMIAYPVLLSLTLEYIVVAIFCILLPVR